MKKVLFSINDIRGGGAERVVTVWASQLARSGYDVSILVNSRVDGEYPVSEKVKIFSVANSSADLIGLGKGKRIKIMRKIIKDLKPDVVISFLERTQIWMMLSTLGMKIFKVETVRNNPWRTVLSGVNKMLWKKCFKRAQKIILQTPEQGEYFSENTRKKCVVIPNPLSSRYTEPIEREYPEKITKFIAAARLSDQKNYPLMIKAFSDVAKVKTEIRLDIFGAGEKKDIESLQALIDSFNMHDRIRLMGRTENLVDEYKKAHAYLMTSDFEGMPNALAEAMATKLVCISSNCKTGPKDLIDDNENGFLFNVGDQKELSSIIEKVTELDKNTAREIGEKAREKVLDVLSEVNSLNRLINVIEEA